MQIKEMIQEVLTEFHNNELNKALDRDVTIPLRSGKIITIIGPRRSGKSFLFFNLIKKLIDGGVKKKQIIYINFEDERLNFDKNNGLDLVLQAYRELYPEIKLNNCFLFFDEIQNINGWERFSRRVYDVYSKKIFITGSNSNLLSTDISTALRGRTLSFEILPLSFKEYLQFSNVDYKKKDAISKSKVNRLFNKYLFEGGFPEMLVINQNLKTKTLQEYFEVMIYRDLIQRYKFTNIPVVKYFLKRITGNTCSYISLHKIYNELRSQSYKLDKNLLYEIFEAARNIYLTLSINKFDYSVMKSENSEKKSYFIDNGLLNALSFKFSSDNGKLLENLVYLELRRYGHKIFYYKNSYECDFIVYKRDEIPLPIQVCYNMQDIETKERELKGLVATCRKLNVKKAVIITINEEEKIMHKRISILIVPVIKLLLHEVKIC